MVIAVNNTNVQTHKTWEKITLFLCIAKKDMAHYMIKKLISTFVLYKLKQNAMGHKAVHIKPDLGIIFVCL